MTVVELPGTPSLPALYGKAAVGFASGLLPGSRGGETVPDRELLLRQVTVDQERLAEYARVCGFRLTDTLPATYPHILAFPLALTLMTDPDFPFPAAGVVHLANRIELRRPLPAGTPLDLAVHASGLREHPRGRCVDLVAVASMTGAEVWREVSTYLHRSGEGEPERRSPRDTGPVPAPSAVWRVEPAVARVYAAVSGDRNPIHTSTLAARAFGFRRRIAHGMWTKARCLAQLAARLPPAYAVEVTFMAPLPLPSTVGFSATPDGDGWQLAVRNRDSGKPHLAGTVGGPVIPGGRRAAG